MSETLSKVAGRLGLNQNINRTPLKSIMKESQANLDSSKKNMLELSMFMESMKEGGNHG